MTTPSYESRGIVTLTQDQIFLLQQHDIEVDELGGPDLTDVRKECDKSGIRAAEECGLRREVLGEAAVAFVCSIESCPQFNNNVDTRWKPIRNVTERVAGRLREAEEHQEAMKAAVQSLVYP